VSGDGLAIANDRLMNNAGPRRYKMRNVLIAAAALVAFASSANAAARHTWFELNYSQGRCDHAQGSPEELYKASQAWPGFVLERIPPGNVTKSDNGDLHVRVDGKHKGEPIHYDLFSTLKACERSSQTTASSRSRRRTAT
jgi:hypothetical protein